MYLRSIFFNTINLYLMLSTRIPISVSSRACKCYTVELWLSLLQSRRTTSGHQLFRNILRLTFQRLKAFKRKRDNLFQFLPLLTDFSYKDSQSNLSLIKVPITANYYNQDSIDFCRVFLVTNRNHSWFYFFAEVSSFYKLSKSKNTCLRLQKRNWRKTG